MVRAGFCFQGIIKLDIIHLNVNLSTPLQTSAQLISLSFYHLHTLDQNLSQQLGYNPASRESAVRLRASRETAALDYFTIQNKDA